MDALKFHGMTLYWLDGGVVSFDGGAIFGVVPKPLWNRKYPANEKNQITHATEPILIQYLGKNYLIDTGIGKGKLTEKQKRNFGVQEESRIDENLDELGLTKEDIDGALMTHMHFDHATGLTHAEDGKFVSTYPNAVIYMTATEWDEVRHPNIRSKSSYWKQNWEAIQNQVRTFEKELEVVPGITMHHTGGHSNGHAIVKLEQNGETVMHMADIMASTAHQNPLWVMAYDDYPMDSIYAKQEWMQRAYQNNYKFIFYHDAYYRMIQWDEEGKEIVDVLKRSKS
ncbi:MBL fold metallo-hydrolase [Alkalibacterium putridalgicola]|uniref:YtnP family quorum-quenching lactonase n=1 Tax=Alkalibacterium putridalgicola TaxID=426703 RepID=UPI0034CEDFCB